MLFRLIICIYLITLPGINLKENANDKNLIESDAVYLQVLGIAQDAGFPQILCKKSCCEKAWSKTVDPIYVSSLGIVDMNTDEYWIIDATPDLKNQIHLLQDSSLITGLPTGILLTHAHIGHYTGLMDLGKEAISAQMVPVYAMPRMDSFLRP